MKIRPMLCLVAVLGSSLAARAQVAFVTNLPGTFVDISTTGGTPITGVLDDSTHTITTSIGNAVFPAGNHRVGNNGAIVGGSTTALVGFGNTPIPSSGFPSGFAVGNGILMPWWTDLLPEPGHANTTIYWQEDLVNGVLTVMWKDDNHFGDTAVGHGVTFEVKVFSTGTSLVQFLYFDTTFAPADNNNNGATATIGYAAGTNAAGNNAQVGYNTANVISAGTVLTLTFPQPEYQVNQSEATFTVDGVTGTGLARATVARTADNCATFGSVTVAFQSTNVGSPWEIALTHGTAVAATAGGLNTGNNILNINLADPSLELLNGYFGVLFPGNFTLALAPGTPYQAAAQIAVISATSVDGFSLSQPTDYQVTTSVVAPAGDDVSATFTFDAVFGSCNGASFSFFGTTYTEFSVCTNGRLMIGGSSTSYQPSVAAAQAAPGTIGCWCDLNTTIAGSLAVGSPSAGIARVDYNGVAFYGGSASTTSTFGVELDTAAGTIQMDSFALAAGTGMQFIGVSRGAGATDPGAIAAFDGAAGGFHAGPLLPTDMVYSFTTEGAGAINGLAAIVFTPSVSGGSYDYTVY